MRDIEPLKERLQALLAQAENSRSNDQDELEERMAALVKRRLAFAQLTPHLFDEILEPRLQLLAEHFDDALYKGGTREHSGLVFFNRHRRYAASASLEMSVECDGNVETVRVPYQFRIIPILMQFQREDLLALPLGEASEQAVAEYVDSKIERAMCSEKAAARHCVQCSSSRHIAHDRPLIGPSHMLNASAAGWTQYGDVRQSRRE